MTEPTAPNRTGKAAKIAVVGTGPAGLMAAEVLAERGAEVTLYDAMRSPARKFLLAGRGGLNLTHSEAFETLLGRYGAAAARLRPALEAFPPETHSAPGAQHWAKLLLSVQAAASFPLRSGRRPCSGLG